MVRVHVLNVSHPMDGWMDGYGIDFTQPNEEASLRLKEMLFFPAVLSVAYLSVGFYYLPFFRNNFKNPGTDVGTAF